MNLKEEWEKRQRREGNWKVYGQLAPLYLISIFEWEEDYGQITVDLSMVKLQKDPPQS